MYHRMGYVLHRGDAASVVDRVEDTPEKSGIVANDRAIEPGRFAQGELGILVKDIDNFDAIGGRHWRGRERFILIATVLRSPLLLFLLREQRDGVTNGVGRAAMTRPGISNKKQYCPLRLTHQGR